MHSLISVRPARLTPTRLQVYFTHCAYGPWSTCTAWSIPVVGVRLYAQCVKYPSSLVGAITRLALATLCLSVLRREEGPVVYGWKLCQLAEGKCRMNHRLSRNFLWYNADCLSWESRLFDPFEDLPSGFIRKAKTSQGSVSGFFF